MTAEKNPAFPVWNVEKKRNWIDIFPSDGNSARKKNMNNNSWLVTFFSVVYLAEFMAAFWFENLLVMLSFQHNGTKNRLVHTKHFPLFKHVSIFIPLDIWSVNWVHIHTILVWQWKNSRQAKYNRIAQRMAFFIWNFGYCDYLADEHILWI